MAVYHGDIEADADFDPARLTAAFGKVKFKSEAGTTAEEVIRPIGIPPDLSRPYLTLEFLLELGNESAHGTTGSKIKVTVPKSQAAEGEFQKLAGNWLAAAKSLQGRQERKLEQGHAAPKWAEKQSAMQEARLAMNAYNRYMIVVHDSHAWAEAKVYDAVLRLAGMEFEFATLLRSPMLAPVMGDGTCGPLSGWGCVHTSWMSIYVGGAAREGEEHSMDVFPFIELHIAGCQIRLAI